MLAALKVHVQKLHVALTHIQNLPLEDPLLNSFIPRPCTWFCICNSVFLHNCLSFKPGISLAAWMQMVFDLGKSFEGVVDGDDGGVKECLKEEGSWRCSSHE